jgi:hypothetical protein
MTPEQELMQKIKAACDPWILDAINRTPFPAALLAAITANESGGNPAAARFEPAVMGQLAMVLTGRRANYGTIGAQDIADYIVTAGSVAAADVARTLINLSTSYGPTQIMGYEALAGKYGIADLSNLQKHYPRAVAMLEDFRKRFDIATDGSDWAEFFDCWNTGRPHAQTADPQYISRGLARMTLYTTL